MEETAKKEKKQSEIKEEKDKKPAGKDKEKKEDQELVRERKNMRFSLEFEFRLSHRAGLTLNTSSKHAQNHQTHRLITTKHAHNHQTHRLITTKHNHNHQTHRLITTKHAHNHKTHRLITTKHAQNHQTHRLITTKHAHMHQTSHKHMTGWIQSINMTEYEEKVVCIVLKSSLSLCLDIMEPKVPDDIYKTHLENNRFGSSGSQVDSARMNLASSFVNGFVNAAFGQDKLLTEDGNKWLYKNKDHGMLSAAASLGMILLWDVDGALLACGIVNSGVRNECDPALALLSDYVLHNSNIMRIGAIFGLGLAYAGSNREDVLSLLLPVMGDSKSSMEVAGVTALACGMIAVGSCNGDVTSTVLQTIMEKSEQELKDTFARWLPLGLGLNHLGKGEAIETTLAALQVVPEPFRSFANTLVDVCAYAGSGNVLKVQQLQHICSEHYDNKDKDDDKDKKDKKDKDKKETAADMGSHQGVAVLGIALIAMGEEIGSEMALRTFGHLLRYGEPTLRRAVPLALALISVSNPRLNILDTLSKFSHDADPEVSHNAIFAMGMVGSGTNNARLAAMLRQLAQYHAKDPNNLFMVRLAQGLTHLGKGTLTLCPYHSDRQLMSQVAVAGLLTVLVSFLDVKNIILGKSHYVLYGLVAAMQPRMLVTFDEELRPLPVSVRVGQVCVCIFLIKNAVKILFKNKLK
uniref:26S proteasome non-ATPase regulatory subunit 2 n=1 Tax=Cyprinus carpio TaxID=7962 RepID=A0A8C1X551_CYPCA